jgi:hypothetical protein
MIEPASIRHLTSLAREFERAATFRRSIVQQTPGAGDIAPAADIPALLQKTQQAADAVRARDYTCAAFTTQELRASVQERMRLLWERQRGAPAKDRKDLIGEHQIFQACLFITGEALAALQREEQRYQFRKALEQPESLLRTARDIARTPRQLGTDNIMSLIIGAARNLVRQEEKMQSMAQEIDSLRARLEELENPSFALDKKRLPPPQGSNTPEKPNTKPGMG